MREALEEGLVQQAKIGANPFKLGLIGATDTHLGVSGMTDEDQFIGHGAGLATSRLEIPKMPDNVLLNPGGLAVVWAEENSRDALFDAMRRREVYGTTGPRMLVRFFGGWDYAEDLCTSADFVPASTARLPPGRFTRIGELPMSMSGPIGVGHAGLFSAPLQPPMNTSPSVAW